VFAIEWLIEFLRLLFDILEDFGTSLDETTVGRELNAMGLRKLSARPRHHAQNEFAVEDSKKTSTASWRRSGPSFRQALR